MKMVLELHELRVFYISNSRLTTDKTSGYSFH